MPDFFVPLTYPLQVFKRVDGDRTNHRAGNTIERIPSFDIRNPLYSCSTRRLLDSVDERLHLVGALAFHLGRDGGVDIHGGGNLGVAHVLLKGLDLDSGANCGDRIRMTKIMEPHLGETGILHNLDELVIHRPMNQMTAQLVREHEITQSVTLPAGASL